MNRKLIRPNFDEIKEKIGRAPKPAATVETASATSTPVDPTTGAAVNPNAPSVPQGLGSSRRKIAPPEQTNAESFYYLKQMQAKTPMVFVLRDGETLHGVIEWYDRCCLKVNRSEGPNILLYKPAIKYMYKEN